MDIIDRINLLLSQRGITGAEMSRTIGLSTAVYSQWNTRSTNPSKKNVKKVADFFGVSVDYLLTGIAEQKEIPATQMGSEDINDPELLSFMRDMTPEDWKLVKYLHDSTPKQRERFYTIGNFVKSERNED